MRRYHKQVAEAMRTVCARNGEAIVDAVLSVLRPPVDAVAHHIAYGSVYERVAGVIENVTANAIGEVLER